MSDNSPVARLVRYAMFNNMAFADVVLAADDLLRTRDSGTVTTREIASRLGVSDSVVRPVMLRLLAAEMLDELPREGVPNGPRLFHRRNGGRWSAMLALISASSDRAADHGAPGKGGSKAAGAGSKARRQA